MLPSSIGTRSATTHFSLQVLTNSRYFCRLSKKRKIGSPVASGAVVVATTAAPDCRSNAGILASDLDELLDQTVDLARLLHVRQVPCLFEDVDGKAVRERFGVGHWDDAVLAAPDDLDRPFECHDLRSEVERLPPGGEPCVGNLRQCRCDTVEPFVAQYILDHCAADERRIVDQ